MSEPMHISKMEEELKILLNNSMEDILAIVICDKDGVILLKATRPNFPEHALEPAFTASFILTSDQMMKAGFGKTTQIISASGQYCTIQWGVASLFLTLFATQNANMGMMIDIGKDLHSYVQNVSDSCDSCR
ncbi:hypothetical protein BDV3_006780 [Batrachochytrium dendrobatidis]|nr:hypothetical protein O5D80_008461 [Batrachochytrium dendrobatidis]